MEAEPGKAARRLVLADSLPRLGVEEDHGAVCVAGRERVARRG